MKDLKEYLLAEQRELETVIKELSESLKNLPEGSLQIRKSNGCLQYYHEEPATGDRQEDREKCQARYIKKENLKLAQQLAQGRYENILLKQLNARLHVINKAVSIYSATDLEQIYEKAHPNRKKLIHPHYISDDTYAAMWQEVAYKGKPFAENMPRIYTEKGERVRSKSEKILADAFERQKIPYRYEYPLEFPGERTIFPDFTLLNKRTRKEYYLEHFGMMDNPEYAENAISRINSFEKHGIIPGRQLLLTFETKNCPLNMSYVKKLIREYLE